MSSQRDISVPGGVEKGRSFSGSGGGNLGNVAMCTQWSGSPSERQQKPQDCTTNNAHGLHAAYLLIVTARSTNDILFGFY